MSEKASSNPNLLLVDDDKSLLRLLTIRLEGEGYEVTAVEDGQSALRKLQNDNYDVVLSDLRMPGLDGLSLFEEIMGIRKDIPVILMTAHGTIADAVAATQRGVLGFCLNLSITMNYARCCKKHLASLKLLSLGIGQRTSLPVLQKC